MQNPLRSTSANEQGELQLRQAARVVRLTLAAKVSPVLPGGNSCSSPAEP
jgi:hypothetical protein